MNHKIIYIPNNNKQNYPAIDYIIGLKFSKFSKIKYFLSHQKDIKRWVPVQLKAKFTLLPRCIADYITTIKRTDIP